MNTDTIVKNILNVQYMDLMCGTFMNYYEFTLPVLDILVNAWRMCPLSYDKHYLPDCLFDQYTLFRKVM